jgi:hypothetical protein
MEADVGEDRATQSALEYLARINRAWPKGLIQSVERKGPHYVVTVMPENNMGILLYFMTVKFWVNASTGIVEKMI